MHPVIGGCQHRMRGALVLLMVLAVALGAAGVTPEDVSAQTGLDPDLIGILPVEGPGGRVLFVVIYVAERTITPGMRPQDAAHVEEYVGRNAVLVWAYSEGGATFDPGKIRFAQKGAAVHLTSESVVPITGSLLDGRVRAGVRVASFVLLGEDIDPGQPFAVAYGDAAYTEMHVRLAVAADVGQQQERTGDDDDEAAVATSGLFADESSSSPSAGEARRDCPSCPPLVGCLTACVDPCDPCSGIQSIFPLFLLLLLGP